MQSNLAYHPLSFGDDKRGRLFSDGSQIVRGVCAKQSEIINQFLKHPVYQELVRDRLIVPAQPIDLQISGYDLVLSSPKLQRVTYPYEWSSMMLHAVGGLYIEILKRLHGTGFVIEDLHPWNAVFEGPNPILVDYGMIAVLKDRQTAEPLAWYGYRQMQTKIFAPLAIMRRGYGPLVRAIFMKGGGFSSDIFPPITLKAWLRVITKRLYRSLIPEPMRNVVLRVRKRRAKTVGIAVAKNIKVAIDQLSRRLANLEPTQPKSGWLNYHSEQILTAEHNQDCESVSKKRRLVSQIIGDLNCLSLTDLGCNRGLHSLDAARCGKAVVAIDSDEGCINDLFQRARAENLNITTVVMSVLNLSPAPAIANGFNLGIGERLSSDLVLVLALIHHLCVFQGRDFESLADIFALFTKRYLVIEFVNADDPTITVSKRTVPSWYTANVFEQAMSHRFRIKARGLPVSETRCLYVLEKLA